MRELVPYTVIRTIEEKMKAVDHLASAVRYLASSWGVDTPHAQMQANLSARAILLNLQWKILDEAELEWMAR